jgi:hypothetical protein
VAIEVVRARGASAFVDGAFFLFGGVAAAWFAFLLLRESFALGWGELWFSFLWWVLLAYLVLPRLQRILTAIYVPNYFLGRARTSDGLLGDPVNIALLGTELQLHTALRAGGWTRADELTFRTGWRIVRDTLTRRSYAAAPVSPLFLFGRRQDFAYQQQVGSNPGSRHHVRFWKCPDGWRLPGGRAVDWVAAGSFDRSVGLSLFTLQVTHRISSDTDAERDHIVRGLAAVDPAVRVSVIEDFSTGYHARNGGGDAIVTDGDLPVVDLGEVTGSDNPAPGTGEAGSARTATPARTHRPAPVVVGSALLGARVVTTVVLAIPLVVARGEVAVILAAAVFIAAEALLAVGVYRGYTSARLGAMFLSALAIVLQLLHLGTTPVDASLHATLSGLSLDVLLVLALSSQRARAFARARVSDREVGQTTGPRKSPAQ